MKPIDEVKRKWEGTDKNDEGRPCPFNEWHTKHKFLWFGESEHSGYNCSLKYYGEEFNGVCTFKDFNDCPLFPHKE